MKKPFYITTTLPYVNAEPHIGFAFELVSADIIARYKKLQGHEVFFNTGTDEHGLKIYRKAEKEGKDAQSYVNEYAEKYRALIVALGISPDIHFIRTTDATHTKAAAELWRRCAAGGDIYKKKYKIKYCVGCELEKTESELHNGRCPIHLSLTLEVIEEENYFFRLSQYQERLLALYEQRADFVLPAFRLNEIRALIHTKGLEDFSISRMKAKMPWGVPVPGDEEQVLYVWFDALVSYISTLGWPDDEMSFRRWWTDTGGVVQFAGKDQIRQQAVMWQAMLMSAGLSPSRQIVIHGFIQSGGEKMSKSLGNVIDPFALVRGYGTDALRYYLARHTHPFEDSDFTTEKFRAAYNADLANGLGNLTSRILKMAEQSGATHNPQPTTDNEKKKKYEEAIKRYDLKAAMDVVWEKIQTADKKIQATEPFKLVKTEPEKAKKIIGELLSELTEIAELLLPFLPETAEKILGLIKIGHSPATPLFPRKN